MAYTLIRPADGRRYVLGLCSSNPPMDPKARLIGTDTAVCFVFPDTDIADAALAHALARTTFGEAYDLLLGGGFSACRSPHESVFVTANATDLWAVVEYPYRNPYRPAQGKPGYVRESIEQRDHTVYYGRGPADALKAAGDQTLRRQPGHVVRMLRGCFYVSAEVETF